jgi:hypothetical protein
VHEKTAPPRTSITHDGLLSVASGCLGVVAVVVLAVRYVLLLKEHIRNM